jgi:heme exporter protein D
MSSGDFWSMGGYGIYVWSAYGAGLVVVVSEVIQLRRRKRAVHKQLRSNVGTEER